LLEQLGEEADEDEEESEDEDYEGGDAASSSGSDSEDSDGDAELVPEEDAPRKLKKEGKEKKTETAKKEKV
jgi:hypothetical protein